MLNLRAFSRVLLWISASLLVLFFASFAHLERVQELVSGQVAGSPANAALVTVRGILLAGVLAGVRLAGILRDASSRMDPLLRAESGLAVPVPHAAPERNLEPGREIATQSRDALQDRDTLREFAPVARQLAHAVRDHSRSL